jgi:hypothetical protein
MFLHVSDVYNFELQILEWLLMLNVRSESHEEIFVAQLMPNEIMSVIFLPKCWNKYVLFIRQQ